MSEPSPAPNDDDLDDQKVIDYLQAHPNFFQAHASLLPDLALPHESGAAVSLIERQVAMQRECILKMRRRMHDLLQAARDNDDLFAKTRTLTLALLDASSWHDLNEVLATRLLLEFNADFVCCHLQRPGLNFDHLRGHEESSSPYGQLMTGPQPVCATLRPAELKSLFPMQEHASDGSAVLLPLPLEGGAGCLAVGSRDPQRFTRNLNTLFVGHIGDVLGRILERIEQMGD